MPGGHHNKGRTFKVEAVRNEEFAALLAECTPRGRGRRYVLSAARLRALYVFMYRSGARVSEALGCDVSDLNEVRGTVHIRHGKGGRQRHAVMDEWAWREMGVWLRLRDEIKGTALFPVITGPREGMPMSSCEVRQQFRETRDRAGLKIRGNPHSLRHGFAVGVKSEINDLLVLQRALGHQDLSTTVIYLRSIDELEALEPVRRRSTPMISIPHVD